MHLFLLPIDTCDHSQGYLYLSILMTSKVCLHLHFTVVQSHSPYPLKAIVTIGFPSRSAIPNTSNILNPNPNNNFTPKSTSPIPKKLHYLIIADIIPCWALGLPLLVIRANVWSILAFIWSTFSSLTSLYRIYNHKKNHEYQIRLVDTMSFRRRRNTWVFGLLLILCLGWGW